MRPHEPGRVRSSRRPEEAGTLPRTERGDPADAPSVDGSLWSRKTVVSVPSHRCTALLQQRQHSSTRSEVTVPVPEPRGRSRRRLPELPSLVWWSKSRYDVVFRVPRRLPSWGRTTATPAPAALPPEGGGGKGDMATPRSAAHKLRPSHRTAHSVHALGRCEPTDGA